MTSQLATQPTAAQILARANNVLMQAQSAADQAMAALDAIANQNAQTGQGGTSFPTELCLFFTYQAQIALIAGANGSVPIQFAADSTFELLRILALTSADVAGNYWQNNFSVQMQDGATGRYMSGVRIPQSCFTTNAFQYGNDEKYPIRFPANSVVNCDVLNLTAAPIVVNIFMKGYKFFQIAPTTAAAS